MIDINELPLKCKDLNSKLFIEEAVNSYKAGAYRSCINNTWLAIVMNITYKIEQLALMSDPEALVQKQRLDKIKSTNDIAGMLTFEREVLKLVKDKFELFDDIVLIDLTRIQEDRNRCSHPLLHANDEPYLPSADQARHHLSIAVEKLLAEGNVFGKAAISKIFDLINSPIFPVSYVEAEKILNNSYLSSPKKKLVENVLKIIFKEILNDELDYRQLTIRKNTIQFIISKFRMIFEETLQSSLNTIIDITKSDQLIRLKHLLSIDNLIWSSISEDKQVLIRNYVKQLPDDDFENIEQWLSLSFLNDEACYRIKQSTRSELSSLSFFISPFEIRKQIYKLYLESGSFNQANGFAETLIQVIDDSSKEELVNLIENIKDNSQVSNSNQLPSVIWKIKKAKKFTKDELNQLFEEHDLRKYVDKEEDQD